MEDRTQMSFGKWKKDQFQTYSNSLSTTQLHQKNTTSDLVDDEIKDIGSKNIDKLNYKEHKREKICIQLRESMRFPPKEWQK